MAVLQRGTLQPVYVLTGPNRYWRTQWLVGARHMFLGESAEGTGMVRLDGVQDFRDVELELASGTLFDPKKMVVVDGGRWPKKEESLKAYSEHPMPDTLLIVVEEKAAANLEKAIGRHRFIDCGPLSPAAFRRFVKEEADRLKIRWDNAAIETFCRIVDGNEYLAVQELDKLSLAFADTIRAADVQEMVHSLIADVKPWDVTDALLRKDGPATMRAAVRHLERGMAPLFLFIILARQVVQIERARRASALIQFQQEEGLRDFVAKKVWAARSQWDDQELHRVLEWAFKIDVAMKTGYGEPEVWLALWIGLWAGDKNPPGLKRGGRMSRT